MKKFFSALSIFLVFQSYIIAQDIRDLDSLQTELKIYIDSKLELEKNAISGSDTIQVKLLFELSKIYWYNDFEKGSDFANQCIELAGKINFKRGVVEGNYCLTIIHMNKGDDTLAIKYATKTLAMAKNLNYKIRIADTQVQLGYIYYILGNTDVAQEYCLKGLKLAEEINYKECIANAYCNLGSIYNLLQNSEKQLEYYMTALNIAKEVNDPVQIAANYHNIAIYYIIKGENAKALKLVQEALKINKLIGNKLWEAYNQDVIGVVHENMQNHKLALMYSQNSANILRELGEKVKLSGTLNNIGWIYIVIKDYAKARDNLNESIKFGLESNFTEGVWATYESLVTLDSIEGKWNLAYQHHLLFIAYRDSVNNKEDLKRTIESGMKFDFDKKQLSDSLKFLQEKEIGDIKLKEQKTYTNSGMLVIIFTIILLFFVYRNFRKQKEANRLLKEAQEQLIRNEKLAAFGMMASRVAHEIQNPLNFVNNFSDVSKELVLELVTSKDENEKKDASEILIGNLNRIGEHGKRASEIIRQLQEHTLKGTAHEFFESDIKQ